MKDMGEESLEELLKSKIGSELNETRPTIVCICNGVLTKIKEIGPTYVTRNNGIIGPGSKVWKERNGSYTVFEVCVGEPDNIESKEFRYFNILESDSIGNNVEVLERNGRLQVHDLDLERWYI